MTAEDNSEEGENEVKSSWPLWTGQYTYYNDDYNKLYNKAIWSKSTKIVVFEYRAVIRPIEVGITSNRGLLSCGENVLRFCTHRPSNDGSEFCFKLEKCFL